MSNVIPIAAPGITAAPLRLQNTAAQIGNAGSNGTGSSGPNLQKNPQRAAIKIATAKARTPITLTSLPAAYSPSFDAGAAGAGGTSVNVNLAYEIVQQIMERFGFAANSQAMKADARAVAAFLDITA